MQMSGDAFIVGETIECGARARPSDPELALCSFDVLGEGARTEADAQRYFDSYAHAIEALGRQPPAASPRALRDLREALGARAALYAAAERARAASGSCRACWSWRAAPPAPASASPSMPRRPTGSISRSTSSRRWRAMPQTRGWDGLGLAVQAYGRRAPLVIDWVAQLARECGPAHDRASGEGRVLGQRDQARAGARARELPGVHLQGGDGRELPRVRAAPVRGGRGIYPQFATHNAYTVAAVLELAPAGRCLRIPASARHGRGALRGGAR